MGKNESNAINICLENEIILGGDFQIPYLRLKELAGFQKNAIYVTHGEIEIQKKNASNFDKSIPKVFSNTDQIMN